MVVLFAINGNNAIVCIKKYYAAKTNKLSDKGKVSEVLQKI